jgi:hypothetical protein
MYPIGYGGPGRNVRRGYGGYAGGYGGSYRNGFDYGGADFAVNLFSRYGLHTQRAFAAQRQQAQMYRDQQGNVHQFQNQQARMQQDYRDQVHHAQAQQERYPAERNRESTQNARMHQRQPRGRVDPDSVHCEYRIFPH